MNLSHGLDHVGSMTRSLLRTQFLDAQELSSAHENRSFDMSQGGHGPLIEEHGKTMGKPWENGDLINGGLMEFDGVTLWCHQTWRAKRTIEIGDFPMKPPLIWDLPASHV